MKILDRIPRFLTSAVVTAGVLYLTLAPRPFGSVRIPLFEGADKVVHFMMFFAMAFAYHFDFRRGKKPIDEARLMGWIFVSLSAFGGLIELAQWKMRMGRSGDWYDLLADIAGAVYGIILAWLISAKNKH
uniref:VanZ family protein n=1 Tax=Candidatus Limisoma sp. TaxID=3076476 RepID=UPI004029A07A